MKNQQLFSISKYTYQEAFLNTQLNMAGSQISQIKEKMEKNKDYMKRMNFLTKFVIVLYSSLLIFLPISAFVNVRGGLQSNLSIPWLNFMSTMTFSAFFLVQILYIILFGLFYISGLFSGEAFHWLSTLPVQRKDMGKICLWTFYRTIDAPFIAILSVFPIASLIVTKNIWIFLLALGISFLDAIFAFSLLILLGQLFAKLVNQEVKSKKFGIIRIFYYILYMVVTFVAVLGIQFGMPKIEPLFFNVPENISNFLTVADWIILIPFPFSGSAALTQLLLTQEAIPTALIVKTIIGLLVFVLLDVLLLRKATKTLLSIVYEKKKTESPQKEGKTSDRISGESSIKANGKKSNDTVESTVELKDVKSTVVSPQKTFIQKDLQLIGRDFQALMFLLMPMIFSILAYIMAIIMGADEPTNRLQEQFTYFGSIFTIYAGMGSFMKIMGITGLEGSGATITSSLPIRIRDQVKSKLFISISTGLFANLIPFVIFLFTPWVADWWKYYLCLFALPIIFDVFFMLLKIRMFGKKRYGYVMEEVNLEHKSRNMIILGVLGFVLALFLSIVISVWISSNQANLALYILLPSELAVGMLLWWIFNRMFPKR